MKYIAHRGNVNGVHWDYENHPNYIEAAINLGYDVEIDVWLHGDQLFLGHDRAIHRIESNFLITHRSKLWVHCKNIDAIQKLRNCGVEWFWHENDTFTMTNRAHIWPFINVFIPGAIVNQPTFDSKFWVEKLYKTTYFYGICDDNVERCKNIIESDIQSVNERNP